MKIINKTWVAEQAAYRYELIADAAGSIETPDNAAYGSIAITKDGVLFYFEDGSWSKAGE